MKLLKQCFVFMSVLLFTAGCGMVGQDSVMVPSYVCVPSFEFTTDSLAQGSNYNRFTDMWISDDGKIIGAVGLPSLLPVQKLGSAKIRVDAGIIISGQSEQRAPYPLVESYVDTLNLQAGVVDTIYPVFKYLPNIDVKFVEDYDRIGTSLKINPSYYEQGDTVLKVKDDGNVLRPGSFSGKVQIASSHQIMQLITNTDYPLPGYGSPVYLEIDYNSNLPLDIGYYYNDPITGPSAAQSVVQTYASNGWRKLYINLTDEVSPRRDGTTYIIYIGIYNVENVVPSIYIDNVKLLCLKG